MIDTARLDEIFRSCLFEDSEDASAAVAVDGITAKYGFHSGRLYTFRCEINNMLDELPLAFRDGASFLNACVDKDGNQWGEHRNIEQLMCLGLALGRVVYSVSRNVWPALPGGMPYFTVENRED